MRRFLVIALAIGAVYARPQEAETEVSAEDILRNAGSGYNTNTGDVEQGVIDDVFGTGESPKSTAATGSNYQVDPAYDFGDEDYGDYEDDDYDPKSGSSSAYGGENVGSSSSSSVNQIVDKASDQCGYYADQGYKCVPYYDCEDGEIITDGGGLIDIRSGFGIGSGSVLDPASSKCQGYLEVCCRHPDFATLAPQTEAPDPRDPSPPPPPAPYISQCGRHNINGIGVRIENSKFKGTTQFGEWPHMCAVLEKKIISGGDTINLYVCGASLIAPGIILTGAHCVQKLTAENTKVRCGEWDTQRAIEPAPHEDRDVESIAIHPMFNPRNLQNDFALLFTKTDFVLSGHIDTICLPDHNAGIYSYKPNDCVATGWGKDKFGKEGEYQVVMKQVIMDTVNSTECQRRLRRTRLGTDFKLHDSFMCAGGEADRDTCKGDGGGPLVCPAQNSDPYNPTYVQAGIIAWGIDCGVEGNPGVYASVAESLCFIDYATKCRRGDSTYFGIKGCLDWAGKQRNALQRSAQKMERRYFRLERDGNATPSNLRRLKDRIRKRKAVLQNFDAFENTCLIRSSDNFGTGGSGAYGTGSSNSGNTGGYSSNSGSSANTGGYSSNSGNNANAGGYGSGNSGYSSGGAYGDSSLSSLARAGQNVEGGDSTETRQANTKVAAVLNDEKVEELEVVVNGEDQTTITTR